ncbi:hypothetical protein Acsp04_07560 [Actinomadura sp. NBRC 104425]|nr:hypothetical protein Acsp04_07560 [Actinomadura sp. NBRC 104425]
MSPVAAGVLDGRVGARRVLPAGGVLAGAGLGFVSVAHGAMWRLYAGGTVRGVGLGPAYAWPISSSRRFPRRTRGWPPE